MAKPKKGEIYGTYNNDMCYERGLAKLKEIESITIDPLDSHTIKVTLKKKSDALEEAVNEAIRSSKGYVELDLENVNALRMKKDKKEGSNEPGVLDTPFYG